jgi:hypothetical protein
MPSASPDRPIRWRVKIYQWGSESKCRTKRVHAVALSRGQALRLAGHALDCCAAAFENARRPVQQLLLPVVDPVRMNAELTRQLGDRPVPPTAATTTPSL